MKQIYLETNIVIFATTENAKIAQYMETLAKPHHVKCRVMHLKQAVNVHVTWVGGDILQMMENLMMDTTARTVGETVEAVKEVR